MAGEAGGVVGERRGVANDDVGDVGESRIAGLIEGADAVVEVPGRRVRIGESWGGNALDLAEVVRAVVGPVDNKTGFGERVGSPVQSDVGAVNRCQGTGRGARHTHTGCESPGLNVLYRGQAAGPPAKTNKGGGVPD